MPTVKKFCFCCSLRTGAVILAWIGIVSSGLGLTSVSVLLGNLDNIVDKYDRIHVPNMNQHNQLFPMIDQNEFKFDTPENIYTISPQYQVLSIILPVMITSCIIGLLGYVLLLIGATRGNRFLLLPWMIMKMIGIVGGSIALLISSFALGLSGLLVFIVFLPVLGLMVYFWICVHSLFQELRETQSDGMALVPPHTTAPFVTDYTPPPYGKLSEEA